MFVFSVGTKCLDPIESKIFVLQELFDAILSNKLKIFQEYFNIGNINFKYSYNPVILLSVEAYQNKIKYLKEKLNMNPFCSIRRKSDGTFIEHQGGIKHKNSISFLHFAIANESMEIVKYLIDQGADLKILGPGDMTSLGYAVLSNNVGIVQLLLEHDAVKETLNWKMYLLGHNDHFTVMDMASKFGYTEIVEILKKIEDHHSTDQNNQYLPEYVSEETEEYEEYEETIDDVIEALKIGILPEEGYRILQDS